MYIRFSSKLSFLTLMILPAVLLMLLLQCKSRRVIVSTLFLLEQLNPISAQGRRLERLRNSVPLWLQLLAVLLATWLLTQPRWVRKDSTQSIVIALDSSISMTVFRDPMLQALRKDLPSIAHAAAKTEWVLIESDPARGTLYSGGDLDALFAALEKWKPHLGAHDPT